MPATLETLWIPALYRYLTFAFDEAPRANVIAPTRLRPVIEYDLSKDLSTVFIDKVVQFDQIDTLLMCCGRIGSVSRSPAGQQQWRK